MTRRQKGKGHKRLRSWHRGQGEAALWRRVARRWPDLGTGARPDGEPRVVRRGPGRTGDHGDAA